MNHSDWIRLRKQGESIALSLKGKGYNCVKKPKQLLWRVQPLMPDSQIYGLVWLPSPVNNWVVIPDVESEEKLKIKDLVERYLKKLQRSSGR